jgi:hypothetical protein
MSKRLKVIRNGRPAANPTNIIDHTFGLKNDPEVEILVFKNI